MKLRRVDNPPNPYLSEHREWLEPPPEARIEVYEETSGSILCRNDSPDLPFTWSVNPYRGCQHACAYCYARPYHEYLGLGAGTDFETKLIVKRNAPELLRKAFARRSWQGESVNFSGITDCYQPIEAVYGITRACLEVCVERANPAVIVTKSFLVARDIDVLSALNRTVGTRVVISIPFADPEVCKLIEPQAPAPSRRFAAMRTLHEAGVPVGVMVAPLIPGLNDTDIPAVLERAAACGAAWAGMQALRLPGNVEPVFLSRIREVMPLRADRIIARIRDMRGGKLNSSVFGKRFKGTGPYWESVRNLFEISRQRFGFDGGSAAPDRRPAAPIRSLSTDRPAPARSSQQLSFGFE